MASNATRYSRRETPHKDIGRATRAIRRSCAKIALAEQVKVLQSSRSMKPTIQSVATLLMFLCLLAVGPKTQAVIPAPDGDYPGFNTAEGQKALFSLTTGGYNTAVGFFSLKSDATGSFNTALGAAALFANTGDQNTATGAGALLSNTAGAFNTAHGAFALFSNSDGPSNTAVGNMVLFNNTTGDRNTAVGESAMIANTTGASNTAMGVSALRNNTTGNFNTAIGHDALSVNDVSGNTAVGFRAAYSNTNGTSNTALGYAALLANSTGEENTAVGAGALQGMTDGGGNTAIGAGTLQATANGACIAIGWHAGATGSGIGNIYIGANVDGPPNELGVTRIANIYSTGAASGRAVYVTSDNILGTLKSSRRYKEEIKPIAAASEAILSLRPVSFRYKKEVDHTRPLSFGLIAEEVAEVSPDLVTPDRNGMPETVRYEAVNAMLLNEFLKEHKRVEEQNGKLEDQARKMQQQEATIAELKKEMQVFASHLKAQDSKIQKVSDQIEITNRAPQMAVNNP
jgi:endosialidase-like protein